MPSSPMRFADPVWDLRDVIGWVLDRDPATFGRLMNEIDVERAVRLAKLYTRWPRPECDPNAQTTLLHALQRGDLVAHDGDTTLPREYWGSRTTRDFRRLLRLAVWFWRDDVLRLWPEAGGPAPPPTPPSTPALPPAAEPKEAAEATRARGKPPIPNLTLLKHLQDIKANGGPVPAADQLLDKVVAAYPTYHVTRQDVRTVHKRVWGTLPPGPRNKPQQ